MSSGSIAKPMLRGSLNRWAKFHAIGAFSFAISMGCIWKFGFSNPRKQKYLDFHSTKDNKADYERMIRAGVFQSVNKDGSPGQLD